jgi:hypothetical protein
MTETEVLQGLQLAQKPWIDRNFPGHKPWHPLLGLVEEFGEFAAAASDEDRVDAVADVVIFAADYCTSMGWHLGDIWRESSSSSAVSYAESQKPETAVLINLGRLCHAHLKQTQAVRTDEDWQTEGRQALARLFALLRVISGVDVVQAAKQTWDSVVSKRDWIKNPVDG